MMSTSDPSQAHPGLYALQMIVGALKQLPGVPQALVSRNPHTSPLGQSVSAEHGLPPSPEPASGAGVHTGQTSHPLASVRAVTPYMQFGRLQIGATAGQASIVA